MRIRPLRPGKGHEEARGGISRRGAAAMQARRKGPRLLWSKHKTSLPAIPDEAAREIWRQPEEQNVKQSPLIHSFPNVSQNTLPASSAFRPFKSAHQGGIETDSGCAAGTLARSLIGLRRCRSSAAMPAPEMFPRPKLEEACAPEPYERATYPRQWISANAKRCIADSELRLFQYTADDIFARLRFLTYAVCLCLCRFPKKRSGGMRVGAFERRLSRPTTASRLPTAFSMASVNPMLLSRQHAMCGFAARGVRTHRAVTAGRKAVAVRAENASVILLPPYLLLAGCLLPPQLPFNANIPIILLCALERISPNGLVGGEAYIFAFLSFFMMSQTVLTFPAPMSSTVSPGRTFASR